MLINNIPIVTTFLSANEKLDSELAIDLRNQGVITSDGKPFQESRKKEIEGLIQKGVFKFVPNNEVTRERRLFNSRFVDEIKGKGTPNPYEKSRQVIQAYNDEGKHEILT